MKYLIPLSYLNEACSVSTNIDDNKFKMSLKIAQRDMKALLGELFYTEIETQYDPTSDSFTPANETLYEDYLKDYLAWFTYYNYLRFSQSQSTPTGEREFNDENSSIISDIRLNALEKNVKIEANNYRNDVIKYLNKKRGEDSDNFPLWIGDKKQPFSYGFSCISKDSASDNIVKINKTTTNNG